jgi:hypothetical protein
MVRIVRGVLLAAVAVLALATPRLASAGDRCADECKNMVDECKKGCKIIPMKGEAKAACPETCKKNEKPCLDLCKSGAFDRPDPPHHDDPPGADEPSHEQF